MTAQEMLIEVNTSLQAIGASRTRKYYPEEIEWYLNKIQNRFVQLCLRRKGGEQTGYMRSEADANLFEVDEMYRDAIRNLLKETYLPTDYTNSTGLTAKTFLPTDYSYALDIGAFADLCTTFRSNLMQPTTMRIVGIPYPADSTKGNKHYFEDLTITRGSDIIYSREGYYSYPAALQVIEEVQGVYMMADGTVISVAVDNIGSFYKPGYILMLVPNDSQVYSIAYEGSPNNLTLQYTFVVNTTGIAQGPVNVPARSVNNSNTFSSGTTPYYKTSVKEITMKINGSVILIDTATNFIVNGMVLSYVRKPRRISVSLNIGSEIAPEFHNQMCDMTVNHIRERIGDPKFQTGLIDFKQS